VEKFQYGQLDVYISDIKQILGDCWPWQMLHSTAGLPDLIINFIIH